MKDVTRRTFIKQSLGIMGMLGLYASGFDIAHANPIKTKHDRIAKKTLYSKLSYTGLDMNVLPLKRNQTQIFLTTYFGSNDVKFRDSNGVLYNVAPGSAHFFEHVKFKKADGEDYKDLFRQLGSLTNAGTGRNCTEYKAMFSSRFEDNLRLLIDMVNMNDGLNDKNIEGERKIILEEWRMDRDSVGHRLWDRTLESVFHTSYGVTALGTPEDIEENINKKDLRKINEVFYHPANMFLTVVGNQKPEQVFELVEKIMKEYGVKHAEPASLMWYDEPKDVKEERVVETMNIGLPLFRMAFKRNIPKYQDYNKTFKDAILISMVLDTVFGKSSDFYDKMYQKGLINDSFGSWHYNQGKCGVTFLTGMAPNPDALEQGIYDEIKKVQKEGIDSRSFKRNKKMLLGGMKWLYNKTEDVIGIFNYYKSAGANLLDYLPLAIDLTVEDGNRLVQEYFDLNKKNRSVILMKPK